MHKEQNDQTHVITTLEIIDTIPLFIYLPSRLSKVNVCFHKNCSSQEILQTLYTYENDILCHGIETRAHFFLSYHSFVYPFLYPAFKKVRRTKEMILVRPCVRPPNRPSFHPSVRPILYPHPSVRSILSPQLRLHRSSN